MLWIRIQQMRVADIVAPLTINYSIGWNGAYGEKSAFFFEKKAFLDRIFFIAFIPNCFLEKSFLVVPKKLALSMPCCLQ